MSTYWLFFVRDIISCVNVVFEEVRELSLLINSMKKLGKFTVEISEKYRGLLAQQGIHVEVNDLPNPISQVASLGTYQVPLFVREEDFEKAVQVIRDHNMESQPRVDEIDRNIRAMLIKIIFSVLALILLMNFFLNN